jgi:hypothetical protein
VLVLGVASQRGYVLALAGVVQVGEGRVVELEVGAAEVAQGPKLVGVGGGEVLPEPLEVGVDVLVDGRPAAAVVDHARGWDRELRRRRRHGLLQEPEGVGEDGLLEVHALLDPQRRRGELYRPLGVAELHAHVVLSLLHAAEPVDKVHVPGGAAELPVRRRPQANLLLHPDDLAYGPVLYGPQLVRGGAACGKILAGSQELGGTQQAPDVVGAEGRFRAGQG